MPATIRRTSIHAITTRTLTVLRVADVTPGMRRVTIGGPQLAEHVAENGFAVNAFRSEGFDDEFKLVLPDPETGELLVPTQNDGRLDWPRGAFAGTRTYTARRWDPETGELDVDVVKHGSGPATTWAYSCQVGDEIQIAGPKMSGAHPEAEWLLIAGDETALPAIGRWLEEMPAGTRADVFIEVASADRIQELTTRADATVTWLDRQGAPAGTTTLLFDALQATPWRSDDVYAWIAGEALTLTPIRRWLRNDKGVPKDRVEVTGYWRRAGDADGADEVEAPEDDADEALHELLEIVPGVAVRVAVTTGIIPTLATGPAAAAALAVTLDLHPGATARLLRYLAAIEIVAHGPDGYTLTTAGNELDDEYYIEALDLNRIEAARTLGSAGLLHSIRTGDAGHQATFGRTFEEVVEGSASIATSTLTSGYTEYVAEPLSRSPQLRQVRDLRIAGTGSLTTASMLLTLLPELRVRLLVTPSQAEAAHAHAWDDPERIEIEVGGLLDARPERSQAFLLLDALTALPDAEARHVLSQAASSTIDSSALLLDDPLEEPDGDEHDLEDDLLALATTGGERRSAAATDALAEAAGLQLSGRETVGWGAVLRRYAART